MLAAFASVTDPLVNLATNVIDGLGYAGVAVLTATTGVIRVPGTEATMLFAGFNVYKGNLTLLGIIVAGVVGDMVGASIAYAIGYYGRARAARAPRQQAAHQSVASLERADRWFERHGAPVIFVSRMHPVRAGGVPVRRRRRADAVRALLPVAHWPARSSGSAAWACSGREVGQQLEQLAAPPRVRRLRGRGARAGGDRLPGHRRRRSRRGDPRRLQSRARKRLRSAAAGGPPTHRGRRQR